MVMLFAHLSLLDWLMLILFHVSTNLSCFRSTFAISMFSTSSTYFTSSLSIFLITSTSIFTSISNSSPPQCHFFFLHILPSLYPPSFCLISSLSWYFLGENVVLVEEIVSAILHIPLVLARLFPLLNPLDPYEFSKLTSFLIFSLSLKKVELSLQFTYLMWLLITLVPLPSLSLLVVWPCSSCIILWYCSSCILFLDLPHTIFLGFHCGWLSLLSCPLVKDSMTNISFDYTLGSICLKFHIL